MKVLKRVFAIAISLAAICVATSAFAAAGVTYDGVNKTIALPDTAIESIEGMTGQVTMAVVPKEFGSTSVSEDIYYINQGAAAEMAVVAGSIGLKGELLVPTNYQVRVGGQDASVAVYNIPELVFVGSEAGENTAEGKVGVIGKITANAGISNLKVLLEDTVNSLTGSYTWNNINITSTNGATFTFGLEINNNTADAALDMSGITITGVETE